MTTRFLQTLPADDAAFRAISQHPEVVASVTRDAVTALTVSAVA